MRLWNLQRFTLTIIPYVQNIRNVPWLLSVSLSNSVKQRLQRGKSARSCSMCALLHCFCGICTILTQCSFIGLWKLHCLNWGDMEKIQWITETSFGVNPSRTALPECCPSWHRFSTFGRSCRCGNEIAWTASTKFTPLVSMRGSGVGAAWCGGNLWIQIARADQVLCFALVGATSPFMARYT